MPSLQNITNVNKDVEDKVNYFIDRFQHFNLYGEYEFQLEIENQLSLIEKINFNLEGDNRYKSEIFESYFSHELIDEKDLWETLPVYQKVHLIFKAYLNATKKDRPKILDSAAFQKDIKQLLNDLNHKIPDILYDALVSVILCPHPLYEHDHILKLNLISRLIVSQGYFSGKTLGEISEIVSRIFLKDPKVFPYPNEVKPGQRKKYLNENNLRNQLSGFKSIMQKHTKTGLVVMKAFCRGVFPTDLNFTYNGITLLGPANERIVKLNSEAPDERQWRTFFAAGDFIYIVARIEYFSFDSIREHMANAVKSQLDYVSAIVRSEVELDKNKNYIVLNSKWKVMSWQLGFRDEKPTFDAYKIKDLANNPFSILSKVKDSPSKDWFLKYESLFVEVHRRRNVSGYWQYLEALLPTDSDGGKQIKTLFSNLLILNEKENAQQRILQTLADAIDFFNGGPRLFNIPYEKLHGIRQALVNGKIPSQIRNSKYPFVVQLLEDYDRAYDQDYYQKVQRYYRSILVEAYNVRNFDVHSGTSNKMSIIKIHRSLPRLVVRLRWIIMDAIKEHPSLPFPLLIEKLIKSASEL